MVLKYRIHCVTENADQYWDLPDSAHSPTHCPNDSAHQVDLASVVVVDNGDGPKEVVTQYEKNDKDTKLACTSGSVDPSTGLVTLSIQVPGSMAAGDGRYIAGGTAFFDVADAGDKVLEICVVDIDNVLGAGANYVVKTYTDSELSSSSQGWFIPPKRGQLNVEPLGGYGFIPAQLYIQVRVQKVATNKTGTFFVNVFWGKKE